MNFDEIEAITTSILDEAHESLGKFDVPIPVEQIVNNLFQIRVEPMELLKGEAGKLIPEDQTIIVNSKDKTERQRFTISHELGHYCLHKNTSITSKTSINHRKETEANVFAAYLLMPRRHVYDLFIKELMDTSKEDLSWLIRISNHLPNSDLSSLNLMISNYAVSNHRNIKAKQHLLSSIVPSIAQKFSVSRDAIMWRLKDLSILSLFVTKEVYGNFEI